MARQPLPPRLPAVHPLALLSEALLPHSGLAGQQVLGLSEPVVSGEEDLTAQSGAAQIVQLTPARSLGPRHLGRSVSHQSTLAKV